MNRSQTDLRLGILGGTFDPPHLGHLILASEAVQQLALDRLLWVLTGQSPFKQERELTPTNLRQEMVQAAIDGHPAFGFSEAEIVRRPPQYAADTVELLAQGYPGAELIYLMGSDVFNEFHRWHRPQVILTLCRLGVYRRPGLDADLTALETELPGISERVDWIPAPQIEITSSDIRRRVWEGRTIRYLVPEAVRSIIEARQFYRTPHL